MCRERAIAGLIINMTKSQPQDYTSRMVGVMGDYFAVVEENPNVRLNEFIQLKKFAKLTRAKKILELPSEGIMLDAVYPNVQIDRADWFVPKNINERFQSIETDFKFSNFYSDCYDAIVGIAPIHHANDKEKSEYFYNSHRVLKQGGVLSFAEVEKESKVHFFLDEFVDTHSSTGHRGAYVDQSFHEQIESVGFNAVESEFKLCSWVFDDVNQLIYFFKKMLGMNLIEDEELIKGVGRYLGIKKKSCGLSVEWGLRYFRAKKA